MSACNSEKNNFYCKKNTNYLISKLQKYHVFIWSASSNDSDLFQIGSKKDFHDIS